MEESMSAVVWQTPRIGYAAPAGPEPAVPARGHLVLVPTGPWVGERTSSGLRLTRRGRVVLTLVMLAFATVIGLFGLPVPGASDAGAAAVQTITVRPGQTLAQIAADELPGLSAGRAITAIRLANELNTTSISAGQTLVIPRT
jgi:hypothetical protein